LEETMKGTMRLATLFAVAGLVVAACSSSGSTPAPSAAPSVAPSVGASVDPGSLLGKVLAAKKIVMSTDPQYPPQSSLKADGTYEGFDIDVGNEIAKRLGVAIEFTTPREKVLAFTKPYYYTPAQMAASTASGITTLAGLAGKTICAGAATTYYDWLTGALDLGSYTPKEGPPAGSQATTLDTDRLCAETMKAGRTDFEGWLSSSTTVEQAIKDGLPLIKVGDPVYYEPLGVAFDKQGPDPTGMVEAVNAALDGMRADGTLKAMSEKWFGLDLTVAQGQ
jgi:polar amino acid transport system substrate-binding protein